MVSESLSFCRLQAADVEKIWLILTPIYQNPQFPLGGGWTQSALEREIEGGQSFGLFSSAKVLVAFILMRDLGPSWEVQILATDSSWQRQGLMSRLLHEVVIKKPAGKTLWLEVHVANEAAQNFYKKHGFREVGRRSRYYHDGADAILYSLG